MSLSIAIASIVTADIALVALLAFVMSRAARLTPHAAVVHPTAHTRLRAVPNAPAGSPRSADSLSAAA